MWFHHRQMIFKKVQGLLLLLDLFWILKYHSKLDKARTISDVCLYPPPLHAAKWTCITITIINSPVIIIIIAIIIIIISLLSLFFSGGGGGGSKFNLSMIKIHVTCNSEQNCFHQNRCVWVNIILFDVT